MLYIKTQTNHLTLLSHCDIKLQGIYSTCNCNKLFVTEVVCSCNDCHMLINMHFATLKGKKRKKNSKNLHVFAFIIIFSTNYKFGTKNNNSFFNLHCKISRKVSVPQKRLTCYSKFR